MINLFHKWLNPHCEHCREEARENKVCQGCEVLKEELAALRYNNQQLLRALIEPKQVPEKEIDKTEYKPINNSLPWRARQQMLEAEDRIKKQVMNEKKQEKVESAKSTEQLEAELLGGENASQVS